MNTTRSHPSKAGQPGARDPFGAHLRHWRTHRRLSQLDLAQEAEVSTRHLSYVETGRAAPSREMVLRLAERLEVPLRERNALLVAAGFAPMYRQRSLDDPAMASARRAIDLVLKGHEPFPALAVDRHWNLVAHNALVPLLMEGAAPELLKPPINVLRLSLHPDGVAPRIANLAQWRTHLLERLLQQIAATGDAVLQSLHDELAAYPAPAVSHDAPVLDTALSAVAVPFQVIMPSGVLSFISTITIFGTPVDVTLQELAVESFFPADEQTAAALTALAAQIAQQGQQGRPGQQEKQPG
ncbi:MULTISPECIES: helix-turn-helix domain-containing protein [unclassified Variovorax]|uniref:helix-turn-helix domain-containing protein n=1 Tax=unclassified Variovorax TaxID=663243 RepID=UPI0008C5CD67|nr:MULTISPECIES: helix-turn-helix transcriptional regulator [unclassified Variovorax]SEJ19345.1 Transcriptional regulator, contains XRE-family HTH domain [Variovorax sp. OK202]SFC10235.1 Transcriptional regulator, contains XRE-family HTH domain [Variovorax sp. OK212]